jgi:hypothetical protein
VIVARDPGHPEQALGVAASLRYLHRSLEIQERRALGEEDRGAPRAASAMEYTVLSPVRSSGNCSTVERNSSTRRLKVDGCNPDRKGKLIDAGNPVVRSQRLIQKG